MNIIKNEPVLTATTVVVVFSLIAGWLFNWTAAEVSSVVAGIAAIGGVISRSVVTPVAKLQDGPTPEVPEPLA